MSFSSQPIANDDFIDLPDIERQVEQHQQAIRDLCEVGIRTDAAIKMTGAAAKKWLIARGYTEREAASLIVRVVQEKREAKERDAEGAEQA